MAGSYPVPGYGHLATSRPQGGPNDLAAGRIDVKDVSPRLLVVLNAVGTQLGKVVTIFSGYRTDDYSQHVGGFKGDPHSLHIATDANIDGTPIGNYPGAVALIHKLGARSGATDFSYNGRSDPAHVDLVGNSRGAVAEGAAATSSKIDSADAFWYAVETKLGLPHDRATHNRLQGWANIEGTKASFNPLATSRDEPGATNFNSDGVKNYPTPEAGIQATADTIRAYPTILAVLKQKQQPFGNPQFNAELNTWSGHRASGPAVTKYVRDWLTQAQGNPKGGDATDWLSGDAGLAAAGTAAKEAVLAVPHFLAKITDTHNMLRGLQIVTGAVLVLVGVVLLTRQIALASDIPLPDAVPVPV